MNNLQIEDKELGRLVIRINPRARRFIFRTKTDAIYVSVPPGSTRKELNKVIEDLRTKLAASRKEISPKQINLTYSINAPFLKLSLVQGESDRFLARFKSGEMVIVCPPDTDFDNEELQSWFRKVIGEALRRQAKVILPSRLSTLSKLHNLPYSRVRVNSSESRWGSCSSKKDINLSYYLVLLPQHLIDYVLLHELTHTLEMSHNDRFWSLLNGLLDNKALQLRSELKSYKTNIP
ncbi:MAG: M48 family metallopeptidase [Bacteroides sp.]|nr:M48 family metallopeptidase [Bacteroides sp.]